MIRWYLSSHLPVAVHALRRGCNTLGLGFEGLELPNELLSHSSLLLVCGDHLGQPTPYGGGCEGRRGSVLVVGVRGGGECAGGYEGRRGVCWWVGG